MTRQPEIGLDSDAAAARSQDTAFAEMTIPTVVESRRTARRQVSSIGTSGEHRAASTLQTIFDQFETVLAGAVNRELQLAQHDGAEFPIGRIDLFFQLLSGSGKNDTAAVRPLLQAVNTEPEHDRPIADQLVDLFIGTNKQRYQTYEQLRLFTGDTAEPYLQGVDERDKVMGAFLNAWIQLERVIRQRIGRPNVPVRPWRVSELDIPPDEAEELASLRRTRNQIVHGIEIPPLDYLRLVTQRILAKVKSFRPKLPGKRRRRE